MNYYDFLITSLVIILLPGTGVIYTIATGLTKGRGKSVVAAIGCTLGIVPHLCVSILLSSLILSMGERVFNVVKIMGMLYLLYLGIGMFRNETNLDIEEGHEEDNNFAMIVKGVLINLLNPKLTLFFFAFLPQYVSNESESYIRDSFKLGFLFMLGTFIVFCGYGCLAGMMKNVVMKSEKCKTYVPKVFGIIFIVFAVKVGMSSL